ncbi:MAG: bifunctional aspartate kinase/homoserine dehydrogenase I [Bacteroidales bacterium]
MKVLKFGGTSVGSVESILNVKKIVEQRTEPVIVVVSALGGITDQLIRAANMAKNGKADYIIEYNAMLTRHIDMIDRIIDSEKKEHLKKKVLGLFDELSDIFKGVYLIKDLSNKTNDTILSYGERLSSLIISNLIKDAELQDSRSFIKTRTLHNKHICDLEITNKQINELFKKINHTIIIPGFISSDIKTGDITNLGRGGSDYTASIIAAALNAERLEIWTDVDGFMTADPRVISNAYVIDQLSFGEAMELCNFGAKVVYPPTIFPVCHKNIPIVIKNTFNPDAPGTLITKEAKSSDKLIKGISSINDTCLLTIQGLGMVGIIGINHRIFRALANSGISVFLVSQAASENNTSIGIKNEDAELAVQVLEKEFAQEIEMGEINRVLIDHDLATVAIVGEKMKHVSGIAGRLFETLGRNGINVIACAQGAAETNISFVVKKDSLRKTLNVIHDSFFLSEYQLLNIFIAGTGTVGKDLINQIEKQQSKLIAKNALKLNVVGIANSRKCIFNRTGINLANWENELDQSIQKATPEFIRDEIIEMNIFNSVFVDCTANESIAGIYEKLLANNVNVVAANKIAASGSYDSYLRLKNTARDRGVKFLFETNVGAGLPIINTMNSLINSGDRILEIEAVLSGTLNFILNTISKDIPLSKTILMAQEEGYAEPDPRIDLSGKDVIRKLVILSREAGYKVEQTDVVKNLFIPEKYFKGTIDEFWKSIPEFDASFESIRNKEADLGKKLRFVAKMKNGETSVSLQAVDSNSPLYNLEGSNNIILLTTERYNEFPMIIKGYGAGSSVTAAGVFADIISIANIR